MGKESGDKLEKSGSGDGAGAPCKQEGGAEEPRQGPKLPVPLKFKLSIKGSALTPPAIVARPLKGKGKLKSRLMRLVDKGQPQAAFAILHNEVLKKAKLASDDLMLKTLELKECWAGKLATPLQGALSGICAAYTVYAVFCERDAINAVAHDVMHQLGLSTAEAPKVAVTTELKSQLAKAGA